MAVMVARPLNRSTFPKPRGQVDYQEVYSKHDQTNWQVFSLTFSTSESVITTFLKQTTIVPVPREVKVTCLNDYCPVALTSVAMKCFEKLVIAQINSSLPCTLDPLQFAYLPNRSPDDEISIALHTATLILNTGAPQGCKLSFCTPWSPPTAWPNTTPTPSLSFLTIKQW
jgi:hypothetical protein